MTRSADDIYDELLVTRCRRHDATAWNELVDRYHPRLLYYLRRLVGDEDRAAGLLQDVWLHVLRGVWTLRDGSRLAPWLYTIARRRAMTELRGEYTRPEAAGVESVDTAAEQEDSGQSQFDNAELVHFGLSRIGPAERDVLTLHFLEDLSLAEIGEVLAIPEGTVKSRLFKARRELRAVLEREQGKDVQHAEL